MKFNEEGLLPPKDYELTNVKRTEGIHVSSRDRKMRIHGI